MSSATGLVRPVCVNCKMRKKKCDRADPCCGYCTAYDPLFTQHCPDFLTYVQTNTIKWWQKKAGLPVYILGNQLPDFPSSTKTATCLSERTGPLVPVPLKHLIQYPSAWADQCPLYFAFPSSSNSPNNRPIRGRCDYSLLFRYPLIYSDYLAPLFPRSSYQLCGIPLWPLFRATAEYLSHHLSSGLITTCSAVSRPRDPLSGN